MGDLNSDEAGPGEPVMSDVRAAIADAMATLDGENVADALLDAVQRVLSPLMLAGFILEPGKAVELRRFVVDSGWEKVLAEDCDFRWMEPLLGLDVANGSSMIGPRLHGATQIAAAMAIGGGRFGYFVLAGEYSDPEMARKHLAGIAAEAGVSTQTMRTANGRAADLAAQRERERLSRDLHDSLSQSLWSLSMLSETAHSMIDPEDPLQGVIRQITEISLTSQEEMRGLLINLRSAEPSRETIGGVLESLVKDFRSSHDVEIIASIADADLDAPSIMAFRRIAEEALNNVGRHADASTVVVLFDAEPVMTLRVTDDGVGFDAKPAEGHLGLRIMEERAEEIGCDFDLASVPGSGTVVTASTDLSQARPMLWRRQQHRELPSMRRALWLLIAAALIAALSGGSFLTSRSYESEAGQVQADLDVLTVLQGRVMVGRASANEATARILEGVGQATADDVERAMDARSIVLDDARREVEPLVDQTTLSGQYALQFLDALAAASVFESGDERLSQLYDQVSTMEGPGAQPTIEATTPTHSLGNLAALDRVLTLSLLESVTARYSMNPGSFTPSQPVRLFFEEFADIVREDGGSFGPEASTPFLNSSISPTVALVHERHAVDELGHIVVDARLWEDDQWLREWTEDAGPPPATLDEYVERSSEASLAGRALIDARFDAVGSELLALREKERYRSQLFLFGAGLLLVGAVLALLLSLAAMHRRVRALAIDGTLDPLTGVGNRKVLESGVAPLLADPLLRHHLVVTLDMDRFKIVNDVHGRALGDRMLEVVAVGLDSVARHTPEVEGVVVRIAGDEFLVSLHSSGVLPVDLVHRVMNRLRCALISAPDGSLVRCSFSYGLVLAEGNPDLDSLMAASDLALYEDKSRTETARLNA